MQVLMSETFKKWLSGLKDRQARSKIAVRIDRLALGNEGDVKAVRNGINEMRIHHGPGYRVYFMKRGQLLVVLLNGGDKSSQEADIERALSIAADFKE